MTYIPGMDSYAAAEFGLEPHGPFVRCDRCGATYSGTTKRGEMAAWLRNNHAPPGWLRVVDDQDEEAPGGYSRQDYCRKCRAI